MEMKAFRRLLGLIVIVVAAIAITAPAASGYPTDPADGVTPAPVSVRNTQSGQTKAKKTKRARSANRGTTKPCPPRDRRLAGSDCRS
jgi:hypothetical protein